MEKKRAIPCHIPWERVHNVCTQTETQQQFQSEWESTEELEVGTRKLKEKIHVPYI